MYIRKKHCVALLFGSYYQKTIGLGVQINDNNRCITNKTIYRKQYTIIWPVDDVKYWMLI